MAVKRIEVILSATAAKFVEAMDEMEDKAHEETDEVSARFDRMGERIGAIFEGIAAKGEEMNIAGSGALGSFGSKLGETEEKSKSFGASMVSLGNKMLLGVAAAGAGIAYESVKIASAYDVADKQLKGTINATGQHFYKLQPAIEAVDAKMTALGFTETQTEQALAAGVIATQSVTKSTQEMGLAADLARYKGLSLAQSMTLIAKATEGNLRPLKQMGIDLNVPTASAHSLWTAQQALIAAHQKEEVLLRSLGGQIPKTGSNYNTYALDVIAVRDAETKLSMVEQAHTVILDALNSRLKGQAELYAQTLPGKIDIFKAKLDTVGREIGNWIIPKLTDVAGFAENAFSTIARNPALLAAGAAVIGAPIIAALGSFALEHIINPIRSLASLFSGEGTLGSKLSNLFGGKNAPMTANTDATTENTAALQRLTDTMAPLKGETATEDTELGTLDSELATKSPVGGVIPAGTSTAEDDAALLGGAGVLRFLTAGATTAVIAGIVGHLVGAKLGEGSRATGPTGMGLSLRQRLAQTIDPISPSNRSQTDELIQNAKNTVHAVSSMFAHINSALGPFGFHDRGREVESYKSYRQTTLDKTIGPSAPGLSPKTEALEALIAKGGSPAAGRELADHATKTLQESQMRALGEIAKALEGKGKSPQVVKLLNEDGLGKLIGTSSGTLIGRALTSALKNQTHDWNLPYVIAQGFSKVDATIGKSLDAHLANSAAHQQGANRTTITGANALNKSASSLQLAATQLSQPASSLDGAATALTNAANDLVNASKARGGGKGGGSRYRR